MKITRIVLTLFVLAGFLGIPGTGANAAAFATYSSGITIQNLTGDEVSPTVYFYDQTGALIDSVTVSPAIPAYGVKDYATIPLASSFGGSAVISSSSLVGAVSTLRGGPGSGPTNERGRGAYLGSTGGSQKVLLPMLMKNWGSSQSNTWISIQNVGSAAANVTVDYAPCAPAVDKRVTGLAQYAATTIDQATETCFPDLKTLTSGIVSATQPVAVTVIQETTVFNYANVSSGFPTTPAETKPVMPMMNSNNPAAPAPGAGAWKTAIAVFNNGTITTNVTVTYVRGDDGTTCTETMPIEAQKSRIFAGNNLISGVTIPVDDTLTCTQGQRTVGSAYVSANSADQPLIATINQDRLGLGSAYGSLAPGAGTPKVVFPQIQDRNSNTTRKWSTAFMIMNVGTSSTFVKCTFANSAYAPTSGATALGSYKAWENFQENNIALAYVGAGECTAYTTNAFTTIDTGAKIVGVVNIRGKGVGYYDLFMTYEGMNVTITP